jgi:hypothetical protein
MSNIPELVLIDEEDRSKLEAMGKWHITSKGYCKKGKRIKDKVIDIHMHRVIMNCPDDMFVDHINHDPLDNRKCNLRIVTIKQNNWNRKSVKGYSWSKQANKWWAKIIVNNKLIHIGYYNTEEEAHNAYLLAKKEHHKI